jgi:octaprenyl-diphosphate synthase
MNGLKNQILQAVHTDLADIEGALTANLTTEVNFVSKVAGHILFSGGKRLRPLLMVLCARMCGYRGDYAATFSIIFEYLHVATLLHDDLVDDAQKRRGQPAAHTVWGRESAVLTGDFLLARALSIASRTNDMRIIRSIAEITENMAQGEIHQIQKKGDITLSESEYRDVIRRKTAVLFQGACRVSAFLANAPESMEKALADYGYHLGMAFQMADDLLDYTQDSQTLGKICGADLREGKLTLPVIHALNSASPIDRSAMIQIILNPSFSEDEFQHLVALLDQYGSITYTHHCADVHILAAKTAMMSFNDSPSRDILLKIADYAVKRKN